MKTKIVNALIIKDFDSTPFYGELVMENDKIVFVGEKSNLECEKTIDAKHNIIMPGFVDCHTHSAMSIFKGIAGEKTLQDWLYVMQSKERKLAGNDVYYGTLLACLEYAKNGITTVCDNYHFFDYSAKAFFDFGMRANVGICQRYSMSKFITEKEMEKKFEEMQKYSPLLKSSLKT